jgi:signal transduction histidine kinase/CheY-like chemotaxis protein
MNVAVGDMRVGLNRMAFAAIQGRTDLFYAERQEFQQAFDSMDSFYFALFDIELSGFLETERDRGFDIRSGYMDAIEVFEERIAYPADGATITAALYDMMEAIDVIRYWMEHMTNIKRIEAYYAHQNAVTTAALSAITQIALLATVIGTSVFIAVYVSGTISKPLTEIGSFAKKVSTGLIDITKISENSIPVDTTDEIGDLARIMEQSYVQLNEYERSKFEAESASQAKSNFLSKMSHEIRTPMNAVMGMSELILREKIPASVRDQAVTIRHSSEHLLSIINDILDFSKIESGKLEITNAKYLFHSTLHDVISIIKMRMQDSPLRFAAYMAHDIPTEMVGDEVRIRQVLINVLSNALKYTKEGHFSLDVTGERINEERVMLTMKIKDTGIGIKDEDMKHLFDEFAQFDLEKNRNVEGTGLGLAITRNLVRLMEGEIEVNSVYGKGTEFIIRLPQECNIAETKTGVFNFNGINVLLYGCTPLYTEYASRSLKDLGVEYYMTSSESELNDKLTEGKWDYIFAEGELAQTAKRIIDSHDMTVSVVKMTDTYEVREGQDFAILIMPAYYMSVVNVLSGGNALHYANTRNFEQFIAPDARILIVDDTPTNLKVAQGLLKSYGMEVETCESGLAAIALVKSNNYDLVLMDHMMPEMDGIEAVAVIRGLDDKKYAELPIVALTANAIVGAREMFLQNGFNDFLSKPIDTTKLNGILVKWIPQEKQKQEELPVKTDEEELVISDIAIDGVDATKGILQAGGNMANYMEILTIFHKDGSIKVEELDKCIESGDLTLYTTYVHAFKSACANIGAAKLSKEASFLESAGLKKEMSYIAQHNDGFVSNMRKLLTDIGDVLAANADKRIGTAYDDNVMKSELTKLKTAIEAFDINAIDEASESLKDFTTLIHMHDALSEILQNAFTGKFKKATAQIERLLDVI